MVGVTRDPGVGDSEQLGRWRLGQRNPLTDRGREKGKEGGPRRTKGDCNRLPQLPPELLTNPSGKAIQSFPSGFRRVPADNEGPRRQLSREVPPLPLAQRLAPASNPDRESHSSGWAEVRRLQRAAGRAPPGRGDGRANLE